MLNIMPIPAFDDNYIWLLHNGQNAVVVDPGDANPVIETLLALQLNLSAILITHHHGDHIDGVAGLLKHPSTLAPVTVYAPQYEQFNFEHIKLAEGDVVNLPQIGQNFKVMWLPGHTLGHIAYVNDAYLCCGDVLFGAGCGRLFEGTPAQMLHSLHRLKQLSPSTQVLCTHEYTAKNIDFALTLDPENKDLIDRKQQVKRLRAKHQPSLPSSIDLELKTNPFLRCNQASIFAHSKANNNKELTVFTAIRSLRNHF
ncbi:MAG: hydroxyacylglutathione hydrolase [Bdellovibrio sp.]|nr:hydroxyacylglutathione hydrolase [Methylotenera sp.]